MSEIAVRNQASRTENNHSNYRPRKRHTSDCSPIVVLFEPGAINAGEDCPMLRSTAGVLGDSGQEA